MRSPMPSRAARSHAHAAWPTMATGVERGDGAAGRACRSETSALVSSARVGTQPARRPGYEHLPMLEHREKRGVLAVHGHHDQHALFLAAKRSVCGACADRRSLVGFAFLISGNGKAPQSVAALDGAQHVFHRHVRLDLGPIESRRAQRAAGGAGLGRLEFIQRGRWQAAVELLEWPRNICRRRMRVRVRAREADSRLSRAQSVRRARDIPKS